MIVRLLIAFLVFSSLQASYIVLDKNVKKEVLYEKLLKKDATLRSIAKKEHLQLETMAVGSQKILKTGEFKDEKDLALFYMHILSVFPKAVIIDTPKKVTVTKIVPIEVGGASVSKNGDFTLWIALFGLGVIALFALYLSSEEIKVIKKEHEKMQKKQEEIIEIQNKILTNMSENIHSIAEEAAKETKDLVLDSAQNQRLENALKKVAKSENRLLDITTDLLEFLRIKSNKISIVNENFHLLNLLNDITGQVSVTDRHIDFDLLYDIDPNVPNTLLGDTLHLGKVAVNIIDYFKQNGAKSVVVEIKKEGSFANAELLIRFRSDLVFDVENDANLFVSYYNEERNRYEGLNLYVAKELSLKMGADLYAKNSEDKTAQFVFVMPFKKAPLPELISASHALPKETQGMKMVLIDKNAECLKIDTKVFDKLDLDVDGIVRREFNHKTFDFSKYNVAVIDEAILTSELLSKLTAFEDLKVLSLSSIFVDSRDDDMLEGSLKRPLTTSQLQESFTRLFAPAEEKKKRQQQRKSNLPVYREQFADTPNVTLESFADFRGASLLVVEDNFINQKVLLSVLKRSEMDIDIADNGQEALELVTRKAKKYDLVLMDINMPVMDGYTATQKIREAGLEDLPIIALSALTSTDEISRMFDVGMNGYLAKPFYKERLYTVFAIFIKKKESGSTLENEKVSSVRTDTLRLKALDIAKGLQNSKNEIFYKEVLEEFRDAFGESDKPFSKLVDEHRYEQARMLAIDIRGLSGAIGANRLHELSIEILQTILFKKFDMLVDLAKRYEEEMQLLNRDIEVYMKTFA